MLIMLQSMCSHVVKTDNIMKLILMFKLLFYNTGSIKINFKVLVVLKKNNELQLNL